MEDKEKIIRVNVKETTRLLWADKKKVCLYAFVAGVIGVAIAFATPRTYRSTVVLAPEESGNSFSGSISSLASMVGMNLRIGQTGDALYPEIYPDLMGSTDFVVNLLPIQVTKDKTSESFTYAEYLQEHQKTLWPKWLSLSALLDLLKNDDEEDEAHVTDPFRLTKKEFRTVRTIRRKMTCSVSRKTNMISITVEDQDPLVAATVADYVQENLQQSITNYRTKKARIDMEYMETLFDEARAEYDEARQNYAEFVDANRRTSLQAVQSRIDELRNEMQLKQTIYQQVVEQLQLAKAKVQENTPAFTIVQSATVPLKPINMSKSKILILWMALGFLIRGSTLMWRNRKEIIKFQ